MPTGSGSEPPLGVLVNKLLGALAASEKFVVQLNPISPPSTMGSIYGGYYRSSLQRELLLQGWGKPAFHNGSVVVCRRLPAPRSRFPRHAGLLPAANRPALCCLLQARQAPQAAA